MLSYCWTIKYHTWRDLKIAIIIIIIKIIIPQAHGWKSKHRLGKCSAQGLVRLKSRHLGAVLVSVAAAFTNRILFLLPFSPKQRCSPVLFVLCITSSWFNEQNRCLRLLTLTLMSVPLLQSSLGKANSWAELFVNTQ